MPSAARPEPQLLFAEFTGGPPRPLREPTCMPAGAPRWRRPLRQVLPCRSGARSCCWYDGGDWHRVNTMAIEALRRAPTQGVDPDGMEEFATAHATTVGATAWESGGMATLFNVANTIQLSRGTGYINGRHRAQAMPESGAPSSCTTPTRRSLVAPGSSSRSSAVIRSRSSAAKRGGVGRGHAVAGQRPLLTERARGRRPTQPCTGACRLAFNLRDV
ncbi:hypothetical protein ABZV75_37800 [Streptomyces flaveolus]|uniref:hypothetical protein n=1 Tax=Streptomyces flaveolus TaxID=67297 RepID=UPI0033AB6FE8